ncbi:Non-catalytic module family DOC2 [Piromyces sp. E2]|nr:Non-catalytic module family DOC2 [Piromyces sp. E2]|eukprot:OUM65264.1 Non-catalytic module family DOC2 [Piromyces sp. E2]
MNTNPSLIDSLSLPISTTNNEGNAINTDTCWVSIHGYPCCEGNALNKVYAEDGDGKWGFDFNKKEWCGISSYEEISNQYITQSKNSASTECWSLKQGYSCCIGCTAYSVTDEGSWGIENNKWCGIPAYCSA